MDMRTQCLSITAAGKKYNCELPTEKCHVFFKLEKSEPLQSKQAHCKHFRHHKTQSVVVLPVSYLHILLDVSVDAPDLTLYHSWD
jgi:hypothetical protein